MPTFVSELTGTPEGYSVIEPDVVHLPIFEKKSSVNHKLPSGPVVILTGQTDEVGMGNSVTVPDVVILATLFPAPSTNHKFPSGPLQISTG
jgi:hypothetical protein